jgi:ribosomal protein L33
MGSIELTLLVETNDMLVYRTLIIRLISTAQTGFFYTTQRLRQGAKLSAVKYDPVGQ